MKHFLPSIVVVSPACRGAGSRRFVFAVAAASILFVPPVFAAEGPWTQLYASGESALEAHNLEEAESLFRKALVAAKQSSNDSEDTQQCMRRLADTLVMEDKDGEAQGVYRGLLSLKERKYGKTSREIVPVLFALGSIQEGNGDHALAMTYYKRAVSINEKGWGPYSPQLGESLHRLGRAAQKAGKYREAGKHYKQAYDILTRDPALAASDELQDLTRDYSDLIPNLDDSDRDLVKDFQADILKGRINIGAPGKNSSSKPIDGSPSGSGAATSSPDQKSAWQKQADSNLNAAYRSQVNEDPEVVLRGFRKPDSSATLAPAYKVVEDTLFNQDRFLQAEAGYKRTIAADIDSLGPNHPAVANDLVALAQAYAGAGRYADAEPLLARALAIYESAYGKDNALTEKTRSSLAYAQLQSGNADKAADLYREALSGGAGARGPNNIETANILNQLAFISFQKGKLEDARTFYGWALASTEGATGMKNPLVAACLKDYAKVLRSLGRTNEAATLESRAAQILAPGN